MLSEGAQARAREAHTHGPCMHTDTCGVPKQSHSLMPVHTHMPTRGAHPLQSWVSKGVSEAFDAPSLPLQATELTGYTSWPMGMAFGG